MSGPKPLVTVIVLTYNHASFVTESVQSAFAQSYTPLEILISDDASSDGTWEEILTLTKNYSGPHTLKINRNFENMGVAAHFSKAVEVACGEIIVYMPGDDIAHPDRASITSELFLRNKNLTLVDTGYRNFSTGSPKFDMENLSLNCTPKIESFSLNDYISNLAPDLASCGRTFRRSAFQYFPPLNPNCPSDDTATVLRCLMIGDGVFLPTVTVSRRIHTGNVTSADNIKNMDLTLLFKQYCADISWAYQKGLLNSTDRKKLETWAGKNIRRRELRRTIESGNMNIFLLLSVVCISRSLSIREKIYAIRKFLWQTWN